MPIKIEIQPRLISESAVFVMSAWLNALAPASSILLPIMREGKEHLRLSLTKRIQSYMKCRAQLVMCSYPEPHSMHLLHRFLFCCLTILQEWKKKDMSQERRLHKHLKESTVMDVLTFSASLNDVAPKSPMLFSMNHNTSELCTLSKYEKRMPNFLFQVLLELCWLLMHH